MDHSINQAAAFFLGVALRSLFHRAKYIQSGRNLRSFWAQIEDDEPLDASLLSMIEEKLLEQTQREVEFLDMVGANALAMLKQKGHRPISCGSKELVSLAHLDSYFDRIEGSFPSKEELTNGSIILCGIESEGNVHTVWGRAFAKKDQGKVFKKQLKAYQTKNHYSIAQQLGLYDRQTQFPRGVLLQRVLERFLEDQQIGSQFLPIQTENWADWLDASGQKRFSIGKKIYSFCENGVEDCIAFGSEFAQGLGLQTVWVIGKGVGKKVSRQLAQVIAQHKKDVEFSLEDFYLRLYVEDGLGLLWPIGQVQKEKKGGMSLCLMENPKHLIASLLEKSRGNLPLWLAPEQVRILAQDEVCPKEVYQKLNSLNVRATIDQRPLKLKEKVHWALRVKVPYVIFFGKREKSTKSVSIRSQNSEENFTLPIEELGSFVLEHKFASQ